MKQTLPYRFFIKGLGRAFNIKWMISCMIMFSFIVSQAIAYGQPSGPDTKTDTAHQFTGIAPLGEEYDEILITLNVPRIGSIEIPAVIFEETAYLPVRELFDFLKIRNIISSDLKSVEGFFIDPAATYIIDKSNNHINYAGKNFGLHPSEIIVTGSGLYLKSNWFGEVFGLYCQFNFRSLSVNLNTSIELPALREMKLEAMHKNLSQLKGDKKADTTISRKFSLFRLGMLDWSVMSTQESLLKSNTRVTLGIGATIAGGETNIFLNYYNDRAIKLKDQYYFWRYVNNYHSALRQVTLGKILANPSSTVYDGITGIQINNTPTTYRRTFGTYTLSDKTEPGWLVELYVNNVLVNYTKADASGFFTFEVPMVYGSSEVKLRFFGPWGEERTNEQTLAIPFNFLPEKQFEYNISAGMVEDNSKSKFSRAQFNYGLSKRITFGGGMEYLSSVSNKVMPFLNASVRLGAGLFLTGEHIQDVRTKGLISYRFKNNLRVELNYLRFDKDQKAIRINYLEEKKLVISKPFRGAKYSAFSRLTLNQFTLSNIPKRTQYTSAEFLTSIVAFGISSNLTSYVIMNDKTIPLAYTNLSVTFRLPHGINVLPQVQYEYNLRKFSFFKAEVEKSIFNRGFLNISYERNVKNNNYVMGIGFRYNLSFVQTAFYARQSKNSSTTTETARGSILYDSKTNYFGLNNQNNVGKGGLIVVPYLDLNCNNKRDKGEPAAPGLKLKINGGRIQRNEKDTTIRVTGLDAYTSYFMELDKNSFDNIAWRINKSTIRINVDPNHFTYLEIPVAVAGEVTGTVYLNDSKGTNGLGRIMVHIYNEKNVLVAKTITEADGYYSYLGLPPGNYTVKVDPAQLQKLNMISSPLSVPVGMKKTKDGDAINGVTFVLKTN